MIGARTARRQEAETSVEALGRTAISIQIAALGERFHGLQRLHKRCS
jgi:hypothetical protein